MRTTSDYRMEYWTMKEERPDIDFARPENRKGVLWHRIGSVLDGDAPVSDYQPLRFVVTDQGADEWHSFNVAGTLGLLSKTVIDLIGPHMTRCFQFLEAWVNDRPFFFLRKTGRIDCLDRANSTIVPFPDEPQSIMEIKRCRFFKDRIPDPLVFVIPDWEGLFATDSIKEMIQGAGLKGFYFFDTEGDEQDTQLTRAVGKQTPP